MRFACNDAVDLHRMVALMALPASLRSLRLSSRNSSTLDIQSFVRLLSECNLGVNAVPFQFSIEVRSYANKPVPALRTQHRTQVQVWQYAQTHGANFVTRVPGRATLAWPPCIPLTCRLHWPGRMLMRGHALNMTPTTANHE